MEWCANLYRPQEFGVHFRPGDLCVVRCEDDGAAFGAMEGGIVSTIKLSSTSLKTVIAAAGVPCQSGHARCGAMSFMMDDGRATWNTRGSFGSRLVVVRCFGFRKELRSFTCG